MLAAYAHAISRDDPLSCLTVGQVDPPEVPADWVPVRVRAASLNHHDLWALKGQALAAERLPMILGTDAAGVTEDGREVVVHAVIGDPGPHRDETLDPRRSLLSEIYPGTLAEVVRVPARNLVDKPASLTFEEAAGLPTAWLTAYRMLATRSGTAEGDDGAGPGCRWRGVDRAHRAGQGDGPAGLGPPRARPTSGSGRCRVGADEAFPSRGRACRGKVDAVMETVGESDLGPLAEVAAPGWPHRHLRCYLGGEPASGPQPGLLPAVVRGRLHDGNPCGVAVPGSPCLERTNVRPVIDRVLPISDASQAFALMNAGEVQGKLVLTLP
jgi:hypothetical protein